MEKSTAKLFYTKEVYVDVSQEMADEIIGKIGEVENIGELKEIEDILQQRHILRIIPLGDMYYQETREAVEAILAEYFVVNRIENLHYFNLRIMN
jgi:hypothetical protein